VIGELATSPTGGNQKIAIEVVFNFSENREFRAGLHQSQPLVDIEQ
jgi:hypothetical protein